MTIQTIIGNISGWVDNSTKTVRAISIASDPRVTPPLAYVASTTGGQPSVTVINTATIRAHATYPIYTPSGFAVSSMVMTPNGYTISTVLPVALAGSGAIAIVSAH